MVIIISIIGLYLVYSASNIIALYSYHNPFYYVIRQFLFYCISYIIMYIVSKIDYHIYLRYSKLILVIGFILLIAVLIFGDARGGSRSWFSLGSFAFQPSELFKICIIIYIASKNEHQYHQYKHIGKSMDIWIVLCLSFFLILLQPDFGSAMVILGGCFCTLLCSLLPRKYFLYIFGLGICFIIMLVIKAPYRMQRILAYLDPFQDPLGSGFQAIQSLFALGPGGMLGRGVNQSIQKHFYLPEPQNDFIFSIFVEETGFIGGLLLIMCYWYLIYLCFHIGMNNNDLFGTYLCLGIGNMLFVQIFLNISVVIGLLPVTGVTLPFLSYGGSSLLSTMIMIGILLNVQNNNKVL